MSLPGQAAEDYGTPLFVAWQLTNGCHAHCLACCEESGPALAWPDELSRDECIAIAHEIVSSEVPYVAFGGGEPLDVPHCWEIFDILSAGGVALKIETNGKPIDEAAADRLVRLAVDCVQISLDGATAATHHKVRPGSSYAAAVSAIQRLVTRGFPPQSVFVPNRLNMHETIAAYEQASRLGCSAFVTGPMMRLGRAAANWEQLSCPTEDWIAVVANLQTVSKTASATAALSIYPWDIVTEIQRRIDFPQAMLLIVPNGRVKLLNALPFAVADLRRHSVAQAWRQYLAGWRLPEVRTFVDACVTQPALLAHANATWVVPAD